jgi:uncharacterized membrane protein YhaH (DUF805 family)
VSTIPLSLAARRLHHTQTQRLWILEIWLKDYEDIDKRKRLR